MSALHQKCFVLGTTVLSLLAFVGACSKETPKSNAKSKVHVQVGRDSGQDHALGLTGGEPLFIGLGLSGDKVDFTPVTLKPGDNEVEVPLGVAMDVKARLLTYTMTGDGKVRYFISDSFSQTKLDASQDALALQFPAYKEIIPINVYGLVNDGTKGMSGWSVKVADPYSGAKLELPGEAGIGKTDSQGVFSFRFLFAGANAGNPREFNLDFVSPQGQTVTKNYSLPSQLLPAFSIGYLNLAGGQNVSLGKSNDDFDGDGILNLQEMAMGTNPFAVNTGACVEPKQVLKGFSYTCADGTNLVGLLEIQTGANCWDVVGDVNADGVKNTLDCRGPKGDKGDNGTNGTSGVSQGLLTTVLAAGNANCAQGGLKVTSWVEQGAANNTIEATEDASKIERFVCNGVSSAGASAAKVRLYTNGGNNVGTNIVADLGKYLNVGQPFVLFDSSFLALEPSFSDITSFRTVPNSANFTSTDCSGAALLSQPGNVMAATPTNFVTYYFTSTSTSAAISNVLSSFYDAGSNQCLPRTSTVVGVVESGINILAATDGGGLYASANSGATWGNSTTLNTASMPSNSLSNIFNSGGTAVVAEFKLNNGPNTIKQSTNFGSSWNSVSGLQSPLQFMSSDNTSGSLAIANNQLFKSTNLGVTYSLLANTPLLELTSVVALETNASGRIWAAGNKGLGLSTDGGTSWSSNECCDANKGIPDRTGVRDIQIYPTTFSADVFVASTDGFFMSTTAGAFWKKLNLPGDFARAQRITKFNNTLYLLADDYLHISSNNGVTWSSISRNSIAAGSSLSSVWVGAVNSQPKIYVLHMSGISFSADGGSTWTQLTNSGSYANMATDFYVSSAGSVYLAKNSSGFVTTSDQGTTWLTLNESTNCANCGFVGYSAYGIAPDSSGNILVASNNSILRSSNGGVNWNILYTFPNGTYPNRLMVTGSTIIASTNIGIVYSLNNGTNFTSLTVGFPTTNIMPVGILGNTLYLGTNNYSSPAAGLQISNNMGATWENLSIRPESSGLVSVVYHPGNGSIYVANDYNVWKTMNQGISWHQMGASLPGRIKNLTITGSYLYAYVHNDGNNTNDLYVGITGGTLFNIVTGASIGVDNVTVKEPQKLESKEYKNSCTTGTCYAENKFYSAPGGTHTFVASPAGLAMSGLSGSGWTVFKNTGRVSDTFTTRNVNIPAPYTLTDLRTGTFEIHD